MRCRRHRGELNRYESIRLWPSARRGAALLLAVAALALGACDRETATRLARRVLEGHRLREAERPLPEAGSIRARLTSADPAGEGGSLEIEWEGARYRETVTSAGVSTVRGIQGGKAFLVDEDGITRVVSEPVLAELITRSYFWRRAYLFEDRERAKLSLGPTDDRTVSVVLRPRGGNELRLVFDRRSDALRRVVSPRFELAFESPASFRDLSRRDVAGEITFTGLPTRRLPDPVVGGWRGRFGEPAAKAEIFEKGEVISIPATISGVPARLAIDADIDGPLRLSPALAGKAGLAGRRDVFGRRLAGAATLQIGSFAMTPLTVEIAEPGGAGIDAVAGGTLYRETVVEIDPASRLLRLHDPDRFVPPEGFGRNLLDDDGNRPAAILFRSGRRLRLRAGTPEPAPLALAAAVARKLGLETTEATLPGLVWGTLRLPPVPVRVEPSGFDPDWGDHGAIGISMLWRFHAFLDMPHRWIYLKPVASR
jgi:hypothetical protein